MFRFSLIFSCVVLTPTSIEISICDKDLLAFIMPLPVLILIICAITIPLIVGVVLIVRNAIRGRRESKTTTNSLDTDSGISKEPTGLEDLESQKSGTASSGLSNTPKKLKEIVLETYRSNRRTSTGRRSRMSVDPSAGRPPLPPNTRIVKYKQSKPKPLSIDDNGNIV